ncbi:hypothetical protein [Halochromatium roseum]|uniref:hypothetical protein n=1 Tax=Halochromatium roseum TaxID=391920 RepID=UPI0019141570|nr:hypothetical protein [Halochromatium roseum]MBK5940865.1 hypothetical protein [Halochromatium roseum]
MAVDYTNRAGQIYHLFEGKTPTGKPRYFFSSRENGKGVRVEKMPEGYEVYEHPENAQVFLRKKRPRLITDIEEQFVKKQVASLQRSRRYLVDCKDEKITIYESNIDPDYFKDSFAGLLSQLPHFSGQKTDNAIAAAVNVVDKNYSAVLRFSLQDKLTRTFYAERFCFRGSIDDWMYLAGPDKFASIVTKYVPLLGTDDFYETPYF